MIRAIRNRLQPALSTPLLRGLGAFGGAELANRVVRLVTTIIIARQLAPEIIGQAALALALFEMFRVLAGIGVGQRIIACKDTDLAATCNAAHRLFWLWSFAMVTIQLIAALVLWLVFDEPSPAFMLAALSLVYLIMPGGLVQVHLAMRDGLNTRLAKTAATQAISDHMLTAALLLAWPSPWGIVLPKLITAPVWLFMTRRNRPWQPQPEAGYTPTGPMIQFGTGVLAAEALNALRTQGDKLIVAATMGTTALGTYYFAYNAGLGIVSSLVGAFGTVSFPILCRSRNAREYGQALRRIVKTGIRIFVPLVLLQALFAPYYVPIVFGDHWAFAAPIIAILAFGGLAHLSSVMTANWLRSQGKVGSDATRSLITCSAALGGLYLGTITGSLLLAAIGFVAGQSLVSAIIAYRHFQPAICKHALSSPMKEKTA